jgi:DNA-directed RNA polymerase specialized sigma24 family protein
MLKERAIGGAAADRATAFTDLAERHLADSYRTATLILGDRADAEDATHDAFVAAWKHWARCAIRTASRPGSAASSSVSAETGSGTRDGTR